ncbi:MAG TPA: transglycosylase SLT domain-containing protein [Paenalcaligenes sp.]|nr:transglycosylase SLT domain-containing protein [Paenalcaligenes sp.]
MLLLSVFHQSHWPQRVVYRMGEVLHLCAIYFGIAALVTIFSLWLVPSTREQTEQIYASVIDTLRPAGWSMHRALVQGVDGETSYRARGTESDDLFDAQPKRAGQSALSSLEHDDARRWPPVDADGSGQALREHRQSAYIEFAQSLDEATEPVHLAGVTQTQYEALQSYIARKYRVAYTAVGAVIDIAYREALAKDLDPLLVLAVIAIESSYNPFAESGVGAQGLMQVMTKVHQEKFEPFVEGTLAVFSPDANIQIGTQILADCLKRRGSVNGALACYVGATGPSDGGYGKRVLSERSRIALASGVATKD